LVHGRTSSASEYGRMVEAGRPAHRCDADSSVANVGRSAGLTVRLGYPAGPAVVIKVAKRLLWDIAELTQQRLTLGRQILPRNLRLNSLTPEWENAASGLANIGRSVQKKQIDGDLSSASLY
jgi:hypothetical protein